MERQTDRVRRALGARETSKGGAENMGGREEESRRQPGWQCTPQALSQTEEEGGAGRRRRSQRHRRRGGRKTAVHVGLFPLIRLKVRTLLGFELRVLSSNM